MHTNHSEKRSPLLFRRPDRSPGQKSCSRGFTLAEMLIVMAIVITLAAIGYPIYANALAKAKITRAIGDIRNVSHEIGEYQLFNRGLPLSLADIGRANFEDPYGNPYEYLNFATVKGKGQMRKDRFLVPINSDYDLYSRGQDGDTVAPLTAAKSRDDIIRANDGGFIGVASEY
ncbi:MAG: type II secretion system protein [Candidatus Methylomirabilales bacterium]